ncbi:MAG: GspH/FimT family pseudopilin [Gemmatimonadota bacterium]|jgi:prepilin-type N-terminal cleavage/methylation domain-containing protein|nr:GspH/FimT family pseudopilin [Gemmatimonadota bacterium]MDP6528431.1 GspH/FimT family pseudopilin [Gemmatimonadota bacterium]
MMRVARRRRGFTATELMVTMGVLGIVGALSWGGMSGLMESRKLSGSANRLVAHLRLAREKAVSEGNNFIVTFRPNLDDYQVWDDEGNDSVFGPKDSRQEFSLDSGVLLQNAVFFSGNRVVFRPDGTSSASGSVWLEGKDAVKRIDVLASTGRIVVGEG